jgi:hypothetical protein
MDVKDSNRSTGTRVRLLAAVVVPLALMAAACGTPSSAAGATKTTDPEEAGLAFARCMREHGVNVPDPKPGSHGGMTIQIGGPGTRQDPAKLQEADKACRHLLKGAMGSDPKLSPEERAKFQDAALKYARCMRDHGVDIPDPDFSGGGGPVFIGGPASGSTSGGGPNPDDPAFKKADEACRHFLPGLGSVTREGPSR